MAEGPRVLLFGVTGYTRDLLSEILRLRVKGGKTEAGWLLYWEAGAKIKKLLVEFKRYLWA